MNAAQPWRSFASTLSAAVEPALPVGPGRWHVLFGRRRRPLLIPAGTLPAQRRCLRHFTARPLQRLAGDFLLWLNSRSPLSVLPELRFPREHAGRKTMLQAPYAAIQIGTPGPRQRASALLMTEPGRPFALAKIAMRRRADTAVEAEAEWLRRLGRVPDVEGQVPRLLEEGTTAGGRRYLVTSIAPSTATTSSFTGGHAHFLAALKNARMRVGDFEFSGCGRYLQEALARLAPNIEPAAHSALQRAVADCEEPLVYWCGPYVISQGDFAPWNIRVLGDRIFVFDWESASPGACPLDDVLHYLLIGRAVRGHPLGARHLTRAMARARAFAAEAYPQWDWRPRVVSAFTLAYLLGAIFRYSAPHGRISRSHPVIRRYWPLMENRADWMAAYERAGNA
jgi:hypothetical protein